jgi:hypothetical protein
VKIRRYVPHEGGIGCAFDLGAFAVGARGEDAATAIANAASLAKGLAKELGKHPELAALLPPQATAALTALQAAAHFAKTGELPAGINKLGVTAARTVQSLLKGLFA